MATQCYYILAQSSNITESIAHNCHRLPPLLWQAHIRNDALRRLHLAAQSGETLFYLMRPQASQKRIPASVLIGILVVVGGAEKAVSMGATGRSACATTTGTIPATRKGKPETRGSMNPIHG
ncbi:hypothetical protein CS8_060520 [Cupriavidus sp. 8B]|jgi:hypothetical protein